MNSTLNEERRDSFRVDMTAFVATAAVTDDAADAGSCFPELHSMALLSESGNIDSEIVALTERVKDVAIKKTLELMHKKLSIVTKLIDIHATTQNQLDSQTINISEGGCCITSEQQFSANQRLALALIFTPSYFAHFSFASIAAVENDGNKNTYHLVFEPLTEIQKQQLLKHMFKAQTSIPTP
ncbi:PilZ domain-containing protein [Reinekea marinisedimentorum]|uniref:PilZ domain-containing protein n=1 Tax=Reinekea marinisedimentorum TaxID=230495 RepID=A0A4V6NY46_9GAMM|nr:PilZ domain-containing protein [Reinekea marinisedimentorum]TCS42576.1 PilZ domain-containing protein [Reinekea marinisedimentorum]